MSVLRPTGADEVVEALAAAGRTGTPLSIAGGGTRAGLGRPVATETTLALDGLAGITLYEPAELVMGARAGTPLATIEQTLAERRQILAFEPMRHGALYGLGGNGSIGGVFASGAAGPRRVSAGAARDHLLGLTLATGRGKLIRSGGRVMKNVTGLDLVRLNTGAMGTLGVLTEVIFKVLPAPETSATLVYHGRDAAAAVALMSAAMGSPYEVSGAAHLGAADDTPARTLLRLEGFATAVTARTGALADRLAAGAPDFVEGETAAALWRDVRDVAALGAAPADEIWRIGLSPGRASELIAGLAGIAGLRMLLDWAGALVWLAAPEGAALDRHLRPRAATLGGHATLVRASPARRRAVPVYEPLPAPLMTLTAGIKQSFDPAGLCNPGRMYEDL
jgi:glycolate oxidase FAD binding subunit